MATLTAAKTVDMLGIPTIIAELDPVPTQINSTIMAFHSTSLNLDLILTGNISLGVPVTGTIVTVEVDAPAGTFAYKFSGLSLDFTLPGAFPDIIGGLAGADQFVGSSFNDVLFGFAGDDTLNGANGNDTLNGGADKDVLIGGRGRDLLYGGTERDLFDFNSIKDSVRGSNRDKILDFKHGTNIVGDDIDLRTIDAKTGVGGNQAFKFIGKQGFHDLKGELRYIDKGASCIVQGDVNGDGKADFEIFVNVGSLVKGDFLL